MLKRQNMGGFSIFAGLTYGHGQSAPGRSAVLPIVRLQRLSPFLVHSDPCGDHIFQNNLIGMVPLMKSRVLGFF